ncbi:MAG: glycoside hydrolase family 28 protein [Halobacteriaceae archaeon]
MATHDVTEYGAVGDGETDDTQALQSALHECADSGGRVVVPPGEYLTAPLVLGDDTTLAVEAGARVAFVQDFSAFPDAESRWEGWDQVGFHPCLRVDGAENVRIEGGGTVDGQGAYWWDLVATDEDDWPAGLAERVAAFRERNEHADDVSTFTLRPPLLQISASENVSVTGVTLRDSPFWNTHVVYSTDVTLTDLTVLNPPSAPNGDGIDVDSSRHVRISDCYIDAGDDAICLKSGKDEPGREVGEPCAQITVTNCTVEAGHGGVVIGSEMSGDVRDVTVTNCTFTGTDRGIRIKTQRGRGGVVEDLRFSNVQMRDVVCPFVVNGYYFMDIDGEPAPVDETTPDVRNVTVSHVTARNVASAAFLAGLPEHRFSNLVFEDVDIEATRTFEPGAPDPSMAEGYRPTHGVFAKSLGEVTFRDVRIETRAGPAFRVEETDAVTLDGLTVVGDGASPAVETRDVGETTLADCDAGGRETLLAQAGDGGPVVVRGHGEAVRERLSLADGATLEAR